MKKTSSQGYALLSVIAIVSALLVAGIATIGLVKSQLHFSADQISAQGAYHIAEAGIERGLAQLDNDAATAATAGYVYPTIPSTSFSGGNYTVTLAQDPLFSSDRSRKLITAIGTLNGQSATVVAHALVQAPQDPCLNTILFSTGGDNVIASTVNIGAINLFHGNLISNNNTHFQTVLALLPYAVGSVSTVGNFYSDSLVVLAIPTRMTATLTRGGSYVSSNDLLHNVGFHFANGTNGHGAGPAPASSTLPVWNWDSAKRAADVIVNKDNYASVVPGSTWSNGVWTMNNWNLTSGKKYYVDGSASVTGVQGLRLGSGASTAIFARGAIGIGTLTLFAAGNNQSLYLVGERDVAIGRTVDVSANVLVSAPSLTISGSITTGISLSTTGVGLLNRTKIYAYSQTGEVWTNNATVAALSDVRACLLARGGNATLATTAAILTDVRAVRP